MVNEEFTLMDVHDPIVATLHEGCESHIDAFGDHIDHHFSSSTLGGTFSNNPFFLAPQDFKQQLPDLDLLHPHFSWLDKDCIHDTLDKTAQHYHMVKCYPFHKHFKSCFPAVNV